jgi:tetratricopeptide (TPR) repeat protein
MIRHRTPVLLAGTLIVIALAVAPGRAAEPAPSAGFVSVRPTPCLAAKYGQGQKCEEPTLPEHASPQQLAAAHMNRARFFIDIGELRQSLVESDAALTLDPVNVDIRHLVARLAMSTGDYDRAERELKTAIQQRPDDLDLRATNAARLKSRSWPEAALHEFDDILTKRPDHRFSREERATLLLSLGRPDEALQDLNILLAEGGRDLNLLALRAVGRLAMNDAQGAITDFSEALKESPMGIDLLTGRAMAYEVLGDDQAALRDYDLILGPINGQPNFAIGREQVAKYRTQRALVSIRLKRFADAEADMMNVLNAGGQRSVLRAQIYLRRNGFPETPLDGQDSAGLRAALKSCFGLSSCFEKISDTL